MKRVPKGEAIGTNWRVGQSIWRRRRAENTEGKRHDEPRRVPRPMPRAIGADSREGLGVRGRNQGARGSRPVKFALGLRRTSPTWSSRSPTRVPAHDPMTARGRAGSPYPVAGVGAGPEQRQVVAHEHDRPRVPDGDRGAGAHDRVDRAPLPSRARVGGSGEHGVRVLQTLGRPELTHRSRKIIIRGTGKGKTLLD